MPPANPHPLRRFASAIRVRFKLPAPHFDRYVACVEGKAGLEIGGPSPTFSAPEVLPLYPRVGSLDNCDFSNSTVWAKHASTFQYSRSKPAGRSIFCDGSALTPIGSESYDFVLSSHNLEHFANPGKALMEWKRVLRPGGVVILVLPFYLGTFDHRREPTSALAMMEDYRNQIDEDDLTHLPEILAKHDLERDPGAGTAEEFRQRSLNNFNNRCLHHHVFDERNIREFLGMLGFEVLAVDLVLPIHICVLARA